MQVYATRPARSPPNRMSQDRFMVSVARHLVGINRLDVARAQFGGGLGGSTFAVPVAGTEPGEKQDGHIRDRRGRAAERFLNPDGYDLPQVGGAGGFGARDSVPHCFLEAGWQLPLRLPNVKQL